MRRVVITGIGLITPLGVGVEATWDGLIAGRGGLGPIRSFDASSLRTRVGGEVADFAPEKFITNRRTLRTMTRNDQFALSGAALAVQDSGLAGYAGSEGERAALYIGGDKEIADPNHLIDAVLDARNEDGSVDMLRFGAAAMSQAYPLFYVEGLQAAALFYISQAYGLKGANTYFAGTAESSAVAVGTAYRAIRRGEANTAVAGGFSDAVSWWNVSKMDALGVLSERNDLGGAACRPYDRDRDGAVMGEGAAFVLLETYEAAQARDARIYAEITGFGSASDAYKLLTPHPEGRGLSNAVRSALRESEIPPGNIGYVAAHGSGTQRGDASEARALQSVFGTDGPPASSVKGAVGDQSAAAGALNVAVAALTLHHRVLPPTLNLENPDPHCPGDWIPGQAREAQNANRALALARGMEGQNIALSLSRV